MSRGTEKYPEDARPNCPRCGARMLSIQPCHYVCVDGCGDTLDCSDTASGG